MEEITILHTMDNDIHVTKLETLILHGRKVRMRTSQNGLGHPARNYPRPNATPFPAPPAPVRYAKALQQ